MEAFKGFGAVRGTDDAGPAARRRRLLKIGGVIAAVVLLVVGWVAMHRAKPAAAPGETLPHVTVIVPGRQAVTHVVTAPGMLAALRDMPVGVAGEGGQVVSVLAEPGDWVKRGQVLAVIDRSMQVEQAASLAANVAVAEADARFTQAQLTRAQALVARGFISRADIDQRTATRDAAAARVRVAKAQLGEQRARIGRLNVVSPTAGLVLTRTVEAGQIVGGQGQQGVLFRVAENGTMELLARLAEQDLAGLKVGSPATVTPVGATRGFPGRIRQLPPIIDATTRQGITRITVGYDPALRPGGFASATITGGTTTAPVLPESAVQSDEKGNFVYIADAGNRIVRRPITIGEVSERGVSIARGLTGQERVVASAGAFMNPGDKIIPERARTGG
ncbi:MAG: efflux RND transporter periplasmic adaptor subunit [Sphingomonas fennica]